MTAAEAFALVARAQFKPFTEADWNAFCGCETENPMIAYVDDFTLVMEDDTLSVTDAEGYENLFFLREI